MRSFSWWKSALLLTAACPASLVCAATVPGLPGGSVSQNANWVDQPVGNPGIPLPIVQEPISTAPTPGSYTFALGADGSVGYGTLSLGSKGNVRLAGTLANGQTFSAGGKLNLQDQYELVAKVKGDVISGAISFARTENADFSATLYRRHATDGGTLADSQSISLTGSLYSPLNNLPLIKLTIRPVGSAVIEHRATLASRGIYTVTDPGSDQVSLSVSKTTGLLAGRVRLAGKWKNLRGVVLQSNKSAHGIVLGGGSFDFTDATSDSSGVIKTGTGTVNVGGDSTGAVTTNGGTLQVGGTGSSGAEVISITSPGNLSGGAIQVGAGTLILNPGNAWIPQSGTPADPLGSTSSESSVRLVNSIVTNGSLNLQDPGIILVNGQLSDSSGATLNLPPMLSIAVGTQYGFLDISSATIGFNSGSTMQLSASGVLSLLKLNGGTLKLDGESVVPAQPVVPAVTSEPGN